MQRSRKIDPILEYEFTGFSTILKNVLVMNVLWSVPKFWVLARSGDKLPSRYSGVVRKGLSIAPAGTV
jgi:hypothetical protein